MFRSVCSYFLSRNTHTRSALVPREPQNPVLEAVAAGTSEVCVEQLFPGITQQSVGEDEVESTEQQMVRIHQVIADHWEVP